MSANKKQYLASTTPAVGIHAADRSKDRKAPTKRACAIIGVASRSTIHRRMRNDPRFPRPIPSQMGANIWWESDLYAYLELPKRPEIARAK